MADSFWTDDTGAFLVDDQGVLFWSDTCCCDGTDYHEFTLNCVDPADQETMYVHAPLLNGSGHTFVVGKYYRETECRCWRYEGATACVEPDCVDNFDFTNELDACVDMDCECGECWEFDGCDGEGTTWFLGQAVNYTVGEIYTQATIPSPPLPSTESCVTAIAHHSKCPQPSTALFGGPNTTPLTDPRCITCRCGCFLSELDAPDQVTVTISGVEDDAPQTCSSFNGVYVLDKGALGNDCRYIKHFGVPSPGGFDVDVHFAHTFINVGVGDFGVSGQLFFTRNRVLDDSCNDPVPREPATGSCAVTPAHWSSGQAVITW